MKSHATAQRCVKIANGIKDGGFEVRVVIISAWSRGGLLPKAAIEQMVPFQAPSATE
jgi:hypothetical protein